MHASSFGKDAQEQIVLELCGAVLRLGLKEKFEKELTAAKPLIDSSLATHWLRLRRAGVQLSTWLSSHLELAALCCDVDDVTRVLSCAGNFNSVAGAVSRLTSRSKLGTALFGFASKLVSSG
eukprot:8086718-Lingulodinium_polyedra.AAC.1